MTLEHGSKNLYNAYGVPSLDITFAAKKSLVDRISGNNLITFTRASIGTYVGSDGLIKSAASGEARFDHDPITGESLGLLVEEARTNAFLNTNTFTGSSCSSATGGGGTSWLIANGGGTLTTNAATAPNGTNTATLASLTASGSYIASNSSGAPTILQGNRICLSVFAKPHPSNASYSFILTHGGGITGTDYSVTFNLDPNGSSETFTDGYSIKLTNGWYRLVINKNLTSGGAILLKWTNPTTDKYYIWGAQGENGAFPTSYIPATTSEVTRVADVASITGTNFSRWYNSTRGTIFTEASMDFALTTETLFPDIYTAGSYPDRLWALYLNKAANNVLTAGADTHSAALEQFTSSPKTFKVAQALSNTSLTWSVAKDGGSVISGSLSKSITNTSSISFGQTSGAVKRIARLTYWSTRLPDATLQAITS